jgi:hypothetical protein
MKDINLKDLKLDELLNTAKDYWIDGRAYEMREEIKAWGGYWNPDKKRWQIDSVEEGEIIKEVFYRLGLKLILIEKGNKI